MSKWYGSAKLLLVCALMTQLVGCASTGRTVAGWFGRGSDLKTAEIDKKSSKSDVASKDAGSKDSIAKSSAIKSAAEKSTAKSSQDEAIAAADRTADGKLTEKARKLSPQERVAQQRREKENLAKTDDRPAGESKKAVTSKTADLAAPVAKKTEASKATKSGKTVKNPFADEPTEELLAEGRRIKEKVSRQAAKTSDRMRDSLDEAEESALQQVSASTQATKKGIAKHLAGDFDDSDVVEASHSNKTAKPKATKSADKATDEMPAWGADEADEAVAFAKETQRKFGQKVSQKAAALTDDAADEMAQLATEKISATKKTVNSKLDEAETAASGSWTDFAESTKPASKSASDVVTKVQAVAKSAAAAPKAMDLVSKCKGLPNNLKELVTGLESRDVEVVKRHVHQLGQVGESAAAAAPALKELLGHADPYVRIHSALALSRMKQNSSDVLRTLVQSLKSSDAGVRSFAAAVVGELGPQAREALPALASGLDDSDPYVRLHVAEVLVRYDQYSARALGTLVECLSDKDQNIRWLATYSLAEVAPQRPDVVIALSKLLNDPETRVRVGAIYALGEIGEMAEPVVPDLQTALTDPNPDLRAAAGHALQRIRP